MATAWRIGIMDIPAEVLMDNILPFCEAEDVLSLGYTNKFFALVAIDIFWRRRLMLDYNFMGLETARMSGWKSIYWRLRNRNPQLFVWGYATFSFHLFINALLT